jgi:hypothetical protein
LDLTTCKTEVYSFEFRDYVDDPLSRTPIREEVEGESDDTSLHHKRSLLLHAKVNHVEEQLKSLVERQQQLVQSVSIGFHGDMQAAIDHIAAISKSVDDIQSLEDRVSEDRRSAKGALYIYLSYLHKDDEMRKQSLEKKCQEHIERLSSIDPELYNMEVELRSLRIAKASISVLGARMSSQLAKLVELRPYAEPLMDEGRILDVDSIQANDMDGGKFDIHARDRETPKFTAPHQMLQVGHRNQDDSSGMRRTGKGKVKDESGTLAQDSGPTIQVLPTYIVPNVVAGPSRKDGEDTKGVE